MILILLAKTKVLIRGFHVEMSDRGTPIFQCHRYVFINNSYNLKLLLQTPISPYWHGCVTLLLFRFGLEWFQNAGFILIKMMLWLDEAYCVNSRLITEKDSSYPLHHYHQ